MMLLFLHETKAEYPWQPWRCPGLLQVNGEGASPGRNGPWDQGSPRETTFIAKDLWNFSSDWKEWNHSQNEDFQKSHHGTIAIHYIIIHYHTFHIHGSHGWYAFPPKAEILSHPNTSSTCCGDVFTQVLRSFPHGLWPSTSPWNKPTVCQSFSMAHVARRTIAVYTYDIYIYIHTIYT